MHRTVASVLVLAALVAPAAAQSDTEEPGPPPRTTDWSTPAPVVVERVDPPAKRFSLTTNPAAWLVGFYGVSGAVALTDNITLRGNVEYFDYELYGKTKGYELALSAPIYLQHAFSGPFLELGVIYQSTVDTPDQSWSHGDPPVAVAHEYLGPEVLLGWHWTSDSGFTVAAALGITRNMTANKMDADGVDDGWHDPWPTGYMRVGYAF